MGQIQSPKGMDPTPIPCPNLMGPIIEQIPGGCEGLGQITRRANWKSPQLNDSWASLLTEAKIINEGLGISSEFTRIWRRSVSTMSQPIQNTQSITLKINSGLKCTAMGKLFSDLQTQAEAMGKFWSLFSRILDQPDVSEDEEISNSAESLSITLSRRCERRWVPRRILVALQSQRTLESAHLWRRHGNCLSFPNPIYGNDQETVSSAMLFVENSHCLANLL